MPDISPLYGTTALAAPLIPGNNYYLSLHSTDPGSNGANEITGGSYARQIITFSTPTTPFSFPSGIQQSTNAQIFINMPALAGNVWFGVWGALSGGNFQIGSPSAAVTGPIILASTVDFATAAIQIVVS